jgi:hypothetical protein
MPVQTQQIPIGGKLTSVQPQQLSTKDAKHTSYAELSAIYDRIYDIADKLFKKYNPCKIYIKDKRIHCKYHQRGIPLTNKYYLCCGNCKHCSTDGCTVKCLSCKLHTCHQFEYSYGKNGRCVRNKKYKSFIDKIKRLQRIANRYGFSNCSFYITKKIAMKQVHRYYRKD